MSEKCLLLGNLNKHYLQLFLSGIVKVAYHPLEGEEPRTLDSAVRSTLDSVFCRHGARKDIV